MSEEDNNQKRKNELEIFVSEEDQHGRNVAKMSDFFNEYALTEGRLISEENNFDSTFNVPISDLRILDGVVSRLQAFSNGSVDLIPDFDALPAEVRNKLKDGTYKIGESRQVEGNLRAVIVDGDGTRIKDITFKKISKNPQALEASRSIADQLQMRQLYESLEDIKELQAYQIDMERDQNIVVPFLNARDFVVRAQNQDDPEKQREYLEQAGIELTHATNSVYSDANTAVKHLVRLTRVPIFQSRNTINKYMDFISQDIMLATKYTGVHMMVLSYLGDKKSAKQVEMNYKHEMKTLFIEPVTRSGLSPVMLMHMNYPYNDDNRDSLYYLTEHMRPVLAKTYDAIENRDVYLVSMEDANAEKSES